MREEDKIVAAAKLKNQQAAYDNILDLVHDKQNEIRSSKVGITS